MADKAKNKPQAEEPQVEVQEVKGDNSLNLDFLKKYQAFIYGGAAVLVLAIVGVLFFRDQQQKKNEQALAEMYRAVNFFEQDSLNLAVNGRAGEITGLTEITEEYGGTKAGNLAQYYVGIAHIREGRLDEGIDALESFKKGDNLVSMSAYTALAFAYEDKGETEKAAGLFVKAAETPAKTERYTPLLYLHAGRCYETAGKPEKALKLYEYIKENYPSSPEGLRIEKYIGRASR
jgi:tetratricopeptide (TPR) repeat protein